MEILFKVGQMTLKGIDKADRKLAHFATDLMGKRVGSSGPIHPKNLLKAIRPGTTWFEEFLPQGKGKVLDLGAGSGSASFLAAKKGCVVTALERHPQNLKSIENFRAQLDDPERILVVAHDLERFPYPISSDAFDAVICNDVIEHLHQRQACLKEIGRGLKNKGKLIITAPNRGTRYKKLRGHFGLPTFADDDHKIEYTREEFFEEMAAAGFKKCIFESGIVIDAPINGLLDMLGPLSLELYHQGSKFKHKLADFFPEDTTGFQMVFEKVF